MSTIKNGKKANKSEGKAIVIKPNGEIRLVDFEDDLQFFYKHIECRCIDIVYEDEQGLLLVLDDEGLLKENFEINVLASRIYGHPLAGTIVVVKNVIDEDNEQSWSGLDANDLDMFFFTHLML